MDDSLSPDPEQAEAVAGRVRLAVMFIFLYPGQLTRSRHVHSCGLQQDQHTSIVWFHYPQLSLKRLVIKDHLFTE
jgi:hypothetical protein